jgi:hypothetical protein
MADGIVASHPHIRDRAFMGHATLTELAEAWCSKMNFSMSKTDDGHDYGLFNSGKHVWGLPDMDVVRHVRHVHVKMNSRGVYPMDPLGTWVPHEFYSLDQLREQAALMLHLHRQGCAGLEPELDDRFLSAVKGIIGRGVKVGLVRYEGADPSRWLGLGDLEPKAFAGLLEQIYDFHVYPL